MNPKLWGANLWYFIHIICITYIPENKIYYERFFSSLKYLLTCQKCKKGYANEIRKNKPDYNNLKQWSFNFHNNVNKRLRKKIFKNEELEKIYYDDNKNVNINYGKINTAITHLATQTSHTTQCKEFLKCLEFIHPSPIWRNKYKYVFMKVNFNNMKNTRQIRQWFNKDYKRLCEEYETISPSTFLI